MKKTKFKVGDIIIPNDDKRYCITTKGVMRTAEVVNVLEKNYEDIEIEILDVEKDEDKDQIGNKFWVDSECFDICPHNYCNIENIDKMTKEELKNELKATLKQSIRDYNEVVEQLVKVRKLVREKKIQDSIYFKQPEVKRFLQDLSNAIKIGDEGGLRNGQLYKVIDSD